MGRFTYGLSMLYIVSPPEPFRKYSKELIEFITDNGIDVDLIAGTHGNGGGGTLQDLYDFLVQK